VTRPAVALAQAASRGPSAPLPAIARRLRLGMPQLDAGGLSEGWLLRYAGDLHWEAIGRQLATTSDDIRSDWGQRLYPTFVAVRARYSSPLSGLRENDVLQAAAEVIPCGRACAHGRVVAAVAGQRLELELLTTFAVRAAPGQLQMALPAARLATRWNPTAATPAIARLARAARRQVTAARSEGAALVPLPEDNFLGPTLEPAGPVLGSLRYQPSPYADYNGAGLLYFASYVTIADTALRQLVQDHRLAPAKLWRRDGDSDGDWALTTSPVRRDVFYYRNLPLGQALCADLVELRPEPGQEGTAVRTRIRLRAADDGQPMADIVTARRLLPAAGRDRPGAPP
jgi:probable biosynthetic protein (TIGR04098 family)